MLQIDLWKRVLIWAFCALGLLFALPNGFYTGSAYNDAQKAIDLVVLLAKRQPVGHPSYLQARKSGIDLRGGAHLLAEVQVDDVYKARMKAIWPELRDILREERATIGTIRLQDGPADRLTVKISEPDGMARAVERAGELAKPIASLNAVGSKDLVVSSQDDILTIQLSDAEKAASDERTLRQALEIIRRRIDEVGTREPTIQRQGSNRILIQVPGIGSAEELKDLIGTTAQLTFQPVLNVVSDAETNAGFGNELLPSLDEAGKFYILEARPVVTGEDLVDAQPSFDQNGRPAVTFRFIPSGARRWRLHSRKYRQPFCHRSR